jgi:23S rRNA maturation-related 3'-5' exoribonuclease YhaM
MLPTELLKAVGKDELVEPVEVSFNETYGAKLVDQTNPEHFLQKDSQ